MTKEERAALKYKKYSKSEKGKIRNRRYERTLKGKTREAWRQERKLHG